jgi:hypothetical protein
MPFSSSHNNVIEELSGFKNLNQQLQERVIAEKANVVVELESVYTVRSLKCFTNFFF